MKSRIAVFASGNGSNLQALLEHFSAPVAATVGAIALIASDRSTAGALTRAAQAGKEIETIVLRDPHDGQLYLDFLRACHIDLIALAGYLKRVPDAVTQAYRGRIVNVHPSLLPAFGGARMYGARVHQAAIAAGVRVSGATVHFVDEQYDHGPIIAQWPVPVFPNDDPATLAVRVLQVEHLLYPRAVEAVAAGRVTLGINGQVSGTI